jgi:hypothetical protein
MTQHELSEPPLSTLLDDYAINAMLGLMQIYALDEWPEGCEAADEWCDFISTRSYYMAAAMMDARHQFHSVLTKVAASRGNDNA